MPHLAARSFTGGHRLSISAQCGPAEAILDDDRLGNTMDLTCTSHCSAGLHRSPVRWKCSARLGLIDLDLGLPLGDCCSRRDCGRKSGLALLIGRSQCGIGHVSLTQRGLGGHRGLRRTGGFVTDRAAHWGDAQGDRKGYPMNRITRSAVGVIASAAFVAVALPSQASAEKPFVLDEGQFSDDFEIPAEFGPCDFDMRIQEEVSFKVTVFFDKNGETRQAKIHANGTTHWGLPGEDSVVTDRWVTNTFLELAAGSTPETPPLSETVVGNPWNAHAGAGGVLVNDSGRIVFDENGDVVSVSGPHEAFFGEFDDFCAAILAG